MESVYLETTFISYLVARPSRDLLVAAHQQLAQEWWANRRNEFEIRVSQVVIDEASAGDPAEVKKRVALSVAADAVCSATEDGILIDRVTAILLISSDPRALADFYRNTLGLPLEDEEHPGVPLHYGCDVGSVHLAIHSSAGFAGVPRRDAQSPVMVLGTSSVRAVAKRLAANGVETIGPTDHGFGLIVSFRDPDGNLVEVLEEHEAAKTSESAAAAQAADS